MFVGGNENGTARAQSKRTASRTQLSEAAAENGLLNKKHEMMPTEMMHTFNGGANLEVP